MIKNCEQCQRPMQLRVFPSGVIESPSLYSKRRFCSLICFGAAQRAVRPPEVRFWAKVNKASECWLWRGAVGRDGYGHFHFSREKGFHAVGAHRVAWFFEKGEWPAQDVLHRCNTKLCVRHEHHYLGGDLENARDRARAGVYQRMATIFRGEKSATAKFSDALVAEIRAAYVSGISQAELVRRYGVSKTHMYRITHGQR